MRWTGPLESIALLTALPVPGRATASTRGVLPWAPLVGVLLGAAAVAAGVLGTVAVSPLTGGVLAVAVLAVLSRGLHLDGLADTADGLGPLRSRERALEVMRQGDVGPFGVVAVVLLLLLQVSSASVLLATDGGWVALWAAVATARLAMTRAGLPGVPIAAGSTLGRAVGGTVRRRVLLGWAAALVAGLLAGAVRAPGTAAGLSLAVLGGLGAAELVLRRARHRLGGMTGDVLGAMAEVTTAITLLIAAALLT